MDSICDTGAVTITAAVSTATVVTKTVTEMINTEKCTWNVRVNFGAPYF